MMRLLCIFSLVLAGCSSVPSSNVDRGVASDRVALEDPMFTVKPSNNFGVRLIREAVNVEAKGKKAPQNVMVSPISAYMAFSIATNGAADKTQAQLLHDLGLPVSNQTVGTMNVANQNYQTNISSARLQKKDKWDPDYPVVKIANSIWNTNGKTDHRKFKFSPEFMKAAGVYGAAYDAKTFSLDFRKESAADAVNAWADKNTEGLVKQIIDKDALNEMLWLIINATYFEGVWAKSFMPYPAQSAPQFHLLSGKTEARPMISAVSDYRVRSNGDGDVVEIPFTPDTKRGHEYVFYAVLPREGTNFESFQTNVLWQETFWKNLLSDMQKEKQDFISLMMPKFSFDYSVEMKEMSEITKAMGLEYLFKDSANFSAMATSDSVPSKVGLIKQSSRIELDEKGVKAAAVTLIGGLEKAMAPRPSKTLVFDRPFGFAIAERKTGALLFVGAVVDPKVDSKQ